MARLCDYFNKRAEEKHLVVGFSNKFSFTDGTVVPVRKHADLTSGAKFISLLVSGDDPVGRCLSIIADGVIYKQMENIAGIVMQLGDSMHNEQSTSDLQFCGKAIFYVDAHLSLPEKKLLVSEAKKRNLIVELYDNEWVESMNANNNPLAFISHDSRDKEDIAHPLFVELIKFPGGQVWYDEYSLKIGDSLRESIEKGLLECKKCVLLLSKNFLSNDGWTKTEYDSIFTRELVQKEKRILPVWIDVTPQEVLKYSPMLADRVAAKWADGAAKVARQIFVAASEDAD